MSWVTNKGKQVNSLNKINYKKYRIMIREKDGYI